jgi:hypothetical protein
MPLNIYGILFFCLSVVPVGAWDWYMNKKVTIRN